ncbi:MAG: nucleotidyl transferase AbiEii/AbiGii toxin family protein [Ignavibacteriaceae bacterium]|nr:nucleotidyl transferase AbiEii/AbiGii toxin family protein [Ignavibacteriaceae bacterium]
MNKAVIKEWLNLPNQTQQNIFIEISNKTGLPPAAVEKDWWVVRTLELVFKLDVGLHTVFKGGTSLSKAWGLIDRFSEDIDLALDRKYLGFEGKLSPSQVKKLREHSHDYILEKFSPQLMKIFQEADFVDVRIIPEEATSNDQDPLIIVVNYPSVTEKSKYLQPRVLLEIGSRSLMEPHTLRSFTSLVGEYYKGQPFADLDISIPTVNPERTFLEKIFLLHEEFQKPLDKIRIDRLSRHLYDIERIMDTAFEVKALTDKNLFTNIIEHRKTITPIRGIDYNNHAPDKINFIPPDSIKEEWEKDYRQMQENMIYKDSLPFNKLLERLASLNNKINKLKFLEE